MLQRPSTLQYLRRIFRTPLRIPPSPLRCVSAQRFQTLFGCTRYVNTAKNSFRMSPIYLYVYYTCMGKSERIDLKSSTAATSHIRYSVSISINMIPGSNDTTTYPRISGYRQFNTFIRYLAKKVHSSILISKSSLNNNLREQQRRLDTFN